MGQYAKKIESLLKHEPFGDLIPVLEYWDDEKIFLCEDPAIGSMLICHPTAGTNEEIRNALYQLWRTDYPKDTLIQAQLVCTPDIESSLHGFKSVRGNRMMNSDQEKCEALSSTIHDFFQNGTTEEINNSGYKFRNFELWFTVKIPIKEAVPSEAELTTLQEITRTIFTRLDSFAPRIASRRDYYRRMRVLLNMYDRDNWRKQPEHFEKNCSTQPLRNLLLDAGKRVEVSKKGIAFYDRDDNESMYVKVHTIKQMPEEMYFGQILNLVGDWENGLDGIYDNYIISLNVVFPDQEKLRTSFSSKRTFVTNQAQGFLLKMIDQLGFQKQDFDAIDRELTQEQSQLLKYSLQVVTFSKSELEAERFAGKIGGFYSKLNVDLVPDNHFVLPFFLSNLPFGLQNSYVNFSSRFELGTSKLLTFLTPHMASWKGNTNSPTMLLGSRLGQIVNLDFYDSETNFNIFLAAASGAGKSFFTAYLVNMLLGVGIHRHPDPENKEEVPDDGTQIFVVDVGRSYQGTAEQYDNAQFLVFGNDFKYSMNPFPNVVDMMGKDGDITLIRAILKTMACPSGEITDLQNALLLDVISSLWSELGQDMTITDVAKRCIDHEEPEIQRFGKQLKPFTETGVYGDYFSSRYPSVSYDSRLVVCELEELKSDVHLQVVVLMSLVMSIQKKMYLSGTDRRKLFIVDEGWQYLKDEGTEASMLKFFAEFLETGWRRFRKTNAAGALVTQSVMDAYTSPAGRAIINNSAWLMMMMQTDEAIARLETEKGYDGPKSDFDMLRSLKTVKPKTGISNEAYSEVFIKKGSQRQICRLYADRRLQLILTTNGDEKAKRQKYMDRGMSLIEAVDAMLKDEMNGHFI
tara:strand:- start:297 stop:2867 length:2571 start_codon:yes stop_codon:yes gene_type:complete